MNVLVRDNALDYTRLGEAKVTLLFIHGSFINKEYWEEQLDYFKINYTVIAMDLPGHGASGSTKNDWSIESIGDDIATFIQTLKLRNIILIGHSMGAGIALEVAVKNLPEVIGIIVIEALKMAGNELPQHILPTDKIIESLHADFPNASESFAKQSLFTADTDPKVLHRVIGDYRAANPSMGLATTKSVLTFAKRERTLLEHIQYKIFIINVDYVPTNEDALKDHAVYGYELHHIHGTSHFPMIEEGQVLNEALERVIDTITADQLQPQSN